MRDVVRPSENNFEFLARHRLCLMAASRISFVARICAAPILLRQFWPRLRIGIQDCEARDQRVFECQMDCDHSAVLGRRALSPPHECEIGMAPVRRGVNRFTKSTISVTANFVMSAGCSRIWAAAFPRLIGRCYGVGRCHRATHAVGSSARQGE